MQINTKYPLIGVLDSRQGGRDENQDCAGFVDTPIGQLTVVCDGVGGGPGGQKASTTAVNIIIRTIKSATPDSSPTAALRAAIEQANNVLRNLQKTEPGLQGMATTVVAALTNKHSVTVAHVGDSRFYQLRFGRIIYCTPDHSVVGEQFRNGLISKEEARLSPISNQITRALGIKDIIEIEIVTLGYDKGDRFVLCSDGVWGCMPETKFVKNVTQLPNLSGTLEKILIAVETIGRQAGAHHDNYTIAIIETTLTSKYKNPMTHRLLAILSSLCILCVISLCLNGYLLTRGGDLPQLENQKNFHQTDSCTEIKEVLIQDTLLLQKKASEDSAMENRDSLLRVPSDSIGK